MAAVNPDGTPGPVAAGELVESAWGNAVAATFTAHALVSVTGSASATSENIITVGSGHDVACGSFTAAADGKYLVIITAYCYNTVTGPGSLRVAVKVNNVVGVDSLFAFAANSGVTVPATGTYNLTAGVWPVYLHSWNTGSGDSRIGLRNTTVMRVR